MLNYPPHFVPDSLRVKCELRDVIHSFTLSWWGLIFSSAYDPAQVYICSSDLEPTSTSGVGKRSELPLLRS